MSGAASLHREARALARRLCGGDGVKFYRHKGRCFAYMSRLTPAGPLMTGVELKDVSRGVEVVPDQWDFYFTCDNELYGRPGLNREQKRLLREAARREAFGFGHGKNT